jgi:hypothetical protein
MEARAYSVNLMVTIFFVLVFFILLFVVELQLCQIYKPFWKWNCHSHWGFQRDFHG